MLGAFRVVNKKSEDAKRLQMATADVRTMSGVQWPDPGDIHSAPEYLSRSIARLCLEK